LLLNITRTSKIKQLAQAGVGDYFRSSAQVLDCKGGVIQSGLGYTADNSARKPIRPRRVKEATRIGRPNKTTVRRK
jgi:hypothetical protein